MTTLRTAEDICLICNDRKSTKKNSHLIPASYIKYTVGKRDSEVSYEIDFSEASLDKYYGRDVVRDDHPGVKQHHYSVDYIFCPECEDRLGKLEGNVSPEVTQKVFADNWKDRFRIVEVNDLEILYYDRMEQSDYHLYYQSIIWRIHLYYLLTKGFSILSNDHSESVRNSLDERFNHSGTERVGYLVERYGFTIVSQREQTRPSEAIILPPLDDSGYPMKFVLHHSVLTVYDGTNDPDADPFSVLINTTGVVPRAIIIPEENFNAILYKGVKENLVPHFFDSFIKYVYNNSSLSLDRTISECLACFRATNNPGTNSFEKIERCKQIITQRFKK